VTDGATRAFDSNIHSLAGDPVNLQNAKFMQVRAAETITMGDGLRPTTNGAVAVANTRISFIACDNAVAGEVFWVQQVGTVDETGIINVLNFGAVADGTTDCTAAIDAAIVAAMGRALFFPPGVYAMTGTSGASSGQIVRTLTGNLTLVGQGAILRCTAASHRAYMMYLTAAGYNLTVSGLTFDANSLSQNCLRVDETSAQGVVEVKISDCAFRNTYGIVGGVSGVQANMGVQLYGGYRQVSITNSTSANHTRAAGAGVPGSAGTNGITVGSQGGFYPQAINIQGCLISNITNGDTGASANNVDADGIFVSGGTTNASTYIPSMATITNNSFVNCKGRSVKIQNDETIVSNNVVRFNILPIAGDNGGIINVQGTSGIVTNNIWHFDVTGSSLNPFSAAGTAGGVGNCCVMFFVNGTEDRPRSVTIENNIANNNVPEATGILSNMVVVTEANQPTLSEPIFVTVKGNRICNGTVQDFANVSLRSGATAGQMFMTMSDNAASKMSRSLMVCSTAADYDKNFISCQNNINFFGTAVRHLINSSSPTSYRDAQIVALNNVNIGLADAQERVTSTSFLARTAGLAPMENVGGMVSIQVQTIADGSAYSFPRRTQNNTGGMRIITSTFGGETNVLFSQSGSSLVSHSNASTISVIAGIGNAGSTAGKLNIGQDGDLIQVRNNTGSSRTVTLYTFG
jgi:hypothetical protein